MIEKAARHRQVPRHEPVAGGGLRIRRGEPLGAELADDVEHLVPRRLTRGAAAVGGWPGPHEHRLIHQADHRRHDLVAVDRAVGAHLLGRADADGSGEDGKACPQRLLGGGAQVVAPGDGVPQRLVTAAALPACQQHSALVKAAGELGKGERAQSHRGEFDGERYAV